jgi:uncharacterized protein (DUF427 family)
MSAIPESTTTARGRVRVEHGAKRIRAYLGGELVADTTRPLLVWEKPYYPAYYFPVDDVRVELLEADGEIVHSPSRGDGQSFTVRAGGKEAASAALRYEHSPFDDLRDAIRLDWSAMDAWFEEDEEVFTHPRDPYTRVDILPSSRHVRVEVDGITLADTTKPSLLFETGHRTRHYLPKTHVRMDLLTPSESVTHCPYKGQAEYWSLQLGDRLIEDVAWSYPAPLPESIRVAGMICFYDEKAAVYVDDVLQE